MRFDSESLRNAQLFIYLIVMPNCKNRKNENERNNRKQKKKDKFFILFLVIKLKIGLYFKKRKQISLCFR